MSTSLQQIQQDIVQWANDVLPADRNPQGGFLKFYEEIGEVLRDPRDKLEWADVFIVLLDLADHFGISGDQLVAAIHEKMAINRKRTWVRNEVGAMQHSTWTPENQTPHHIAITHGEGMPLLVAAMSPFKDVKTTLPDCPHAHPFRYCERCEHDPCPIGLTNKQTGG